MLNHYLLFIISQELLNNLEATKDEEIEEKQKNISDLLDQLKERQESYDQYVQDKDTEMSNMKDEFQVELDKNNEFVLNQINVLKQELAESRLVFFYIHNYHVSPSIISCAMEFCPFLAV